MAQQPIGPLSASPAGPFTVIASRCVTASQHVLVRPTIQMCSDCLTDWSVTDIISATDDKRYEQAMLNYAGEAAKVGNSYTTTLWQRPQPLW